MKKRIITPPDYVTVTSLRTIQWNYADSTEFIEGNSYTIPSSLYQSLAKYFVINDKEIKETDNASSE